MVNGNDLAGIGTLMLGVGAIGTSAMAWRRGRTHSQILGEVKAKVEGIDEAVNQVAPGHPTLSNRMDRVLNEGQAATVAARNCVVALVRVEAAIREVQATQHATARVLDELTEGSNEEHAAIWTALAENGIDRRKTTDTSNNRKDP